MTLLATLKDFYWEHRDLFRAALAMALITLVNGALLLWIARRLQELSLIRERVSRLADGLALLTDTTEAGLSTLIREVEGLGRRRTPAKTASRAIVTRRVVTAANSGESLARIAEHESMSETEVGLHLSMARAVEPAGQAAAAASQEL
jgi:hypothetical protein